MWVWRRSSEALRLGARVLATAGSDAKRALVLELGAEAAFDSRSAAFGVVGDGGDGWARGGCGAQFAGRGQDWGGACGVLAPGGRFIELGELTVLNDKERAALRPDIRYEVVQLRTELAVPTPESLETIASVLRDFEAGKLRPLPWTRFGLNDAAEAFRMMAAGLHTGRVCSYRPTGIWKRLAEAKRLRGFRVSGATGLMWFRGRLADWDWRWWNGWRSRGQDVCWRWVAVHRRRRLRLAWNG